MVFWILAAIPFVILVGVIIYEMTSWGDDFFSALGTGIAYSTVAGVAAGLVFFVLCVIGTAGGSDVVGTEKQTLRAISAGDSLSGLFFLGSGTIDGERVLNYIVSEDGYSLVEQISAKGVPIYEDTDEAYKQTTWYGTKDTSWLAPFSVDFGIHSKAEFHIPEGSILESYTIKN